MVYNSYLIEQDSGGQLRVRSIDMEKEHEIFENFIVIEGLDGAGTTTQLKLLERRLKGYKIPFCCTCEPTRGLIGKVIRSVLRGKCRVNPYSLALLFAADRTEHVEDPGEGIAARVKRGELIISDRYLFSSLAYQSVQCGFEKVLSLNERFPLPSHLIFIDTPPEVCQQRLDQRGKRDLFDGLSFQEKVYQFYFRGIDYFTDSSMKVHRIEGDQPSAIIFQSLWDLLCELPILKA